MIAWQPWAETGNNLPLLGDAQAAHGVFDTVASSSPVLYGQSASFDIGAPKHGRLSLAAMLATTNDGFVALNGVPLPRHSARYLASVYDAGSENNNEMRVVPMYRDRLVPPIREKSPMMVKVMSVFIVAFMAAVI